MERMGRGTGIPKGRDFAALNRDGFVCFGKKLTSLRFTQSAQSEGAEDAETPPLTPSTGSGQAPPQGRGGICWQVPSHGR